MWAHYANKHSGFCVEYELTECMRHMDAVLAPVKYSDKRPLLELPPPEYLDENRRNPDIIRDYNEKVWRTFLVKSDIWQYEKEYRIFVPNKDSASIKDVNITAIYLGVNKSSSNKQKIWDIVTHDSRFQHTRIYHLRTTEREFVLKPYVAW